MQHLAKVMKRIIYPFTYILDNFARKIDERQSTVILTKTVLFMKNFTKLFCTAFLLLAGGMGATAQDETIELTKDMFYTWDGYGADASSISTANVDFNLGTTLGGGGVVCGTGTVSYLTYADLTGCSKMLFEGTPGLGLRVLMNRQESDQGPLVEKNPKIGDDGKAELDLTELAYVHINAIKVAWGAEGQVTSIKMVKPSDPLSINKEQLKAAISSAKLRNSFAKTEASWNALQKAITDAEAALAAATDAASLDAAKDAVEAAVKGLTLLEGYSDLTADMFKKYASVDEPGNPQDAGCSYELFKAHDLPYGDGSVGELNWADLTPYSKLYVTTVGDVKPRFCLNRLVKDGQQAATQEDSKMLDINPNNDFTWSTEKYLTAENGIYTLDVAAIVKDYRFARLHCIKKQGWGAGVIVTGMYLYKAPEAPKHTWDFTAWSDATISNLKAEAAKVTVEDDPENEGKTKCTMNDAFWSDHEKANKCDTYDASKNNCFWYVGGEAEPTANGEAIAELKGLVFNDAYGKGRSLAIAVNYPSTSLGTYEGPSYLWLGGKDKDCFTIKSVKVGSELVIAAESHKPAEARGIQLKINGENFGNPFTPTTFAENTWTITSSDETAKVVDVVVHNTNGCHLYYIDAVIDNTVTGIQTVTTTKENGAYYDLQGRRVAQPTKGLYILNGKKVMIK